MCVRVCIYLIFTTTTPCAVYATVFLLSAPGAVAYAILSLEYRWKYGNRLVDQKIRFPDIRGGGGGGG